MNIRQKLEHALKYGYPVCIKLENGNVGTGFIRSLSKTGVSIDWGVPYCLDRIISVEAGSEITEEATAQISPGMKNLIDSFADEKEKLEKAIIAWRKEMASFIREHNEASKDCDDTPDVEIAEIGRDEEWAWKGQGVGEGTWALWKVRQFRRGRPGSGDCPTVRIVGEFAEEKDAKAAATLPDLVKQRDRLLEIAKEFTVETYVTFAAFESRDKALHVIIDEVESNLLIRLTDNK